MNRIVGDNVGLYDLVDVMAITKVPQVERVSPTETREKPAHAKLHYLGLILSTTLDYDETVDQWLAVKAAENHPVERMATLGSEQNEQSDKLS
jgi:hypothetical protein